MKENETSKQKIIKLAGKLFAEKGYDSVGVAEICDAAEVSKGTFYHHFESKESLFLTLLEKWLEVVDQKLSCFSQLNSTWEDGLSYITQFLKELALESSKQNIIFLEFYSKAIRNQSIWNRLNQEMDHYENLIAQLIQLGIKQKMLKPIDVNQTAKTTIAFVMGLLLQGWFSQKPEDMEAFFSHSLHLFLKGIQS
jgi:AcrR family transcriptional regulator